MTKEYAAAFSTLAVRDHEPPDEFILQDYKEFRKWWDVYSKNPEVGEDPFKKYSHGFRVK